MKKILITAFHPIISRNILSSGTLAELATHQDVAVVLVVPDYKVEYFTKTYGSSKILVVGVPLYQASKTRVGLFFKKLGIFLFNTKSARQRKEYDYYCTGKIMRYALSMILGVIGSSFVVRKIVRLIDFHFSPKGFFTEILLQHKPDLIFSTDVQNENDVSLMQDARRLRIPIVSMVRSWDNLSLRILRIFPDKLFVGSIELFNETQDLHRYPKEDVVITGNPHYCSYLAGATKTREQFLESYGLPIHKKLILYAPVSDALIRENDIDAHALSVLAGVPASILVRFPPEKPVTLKDFEKSKNMAYDRTGRVFKTENSGDQELRPEDEESLINSLTYADLIVTGPTSICIDAALKDKPVIMVNFYPSQRHFFETVWRYKDTHIAKMLSTKGIHLSDTKEDFLRMIDVYLNDPMVDKEGRAEIRSKWFSQISSHVNAQTFLPSVLLELLDMASLGKRL